MFGIEELQLRVIPGEQLWFRKRTASIAIICTVESWSLRLRMVPIPFFVMKTTVRLLSMLLIIESTCIAQTLKDPVPKTSGLRISKVFLNLTGDPKLTHRFWSYLGFEIEDLGMSLATTEEDADAILSMQLTTEKSRTVLGSGLIQLQITKGGNTKTLDV